MMELKDTLRNNLKGEALTNALGFADYLAEKGLTPKKEWAMGFRFIKNDKSPCLIVLLQNGEGWFICDIPAAYEPEWDSLNDDLKAFLVSHIKTCTVHEGGKCGCGSEPGIKSKIFGIEYDNTCTSQIQLINPDAVVLDRFKEVVEWWVEEVGA
jgi:hypothetical protein